MHKRAKARRSVPGWAQVLIATMAGTVFMGCCGAVVAWFPAVLQLVFAPMAGMCAMAFALQVQHWCDERWPDA